MHGTLDLTALWFILWRVAELSACIHCLACISPSQSLASSFAPADGMAAFLAAAAAAVRKRKRLVCVSRWLCCLGACRGPAAQRHPHTNMLLDPSPGTFASISLTSRTNSCSGSRRSCVDRVSRLETRCSRQPSRHTSYSIHPRPGTAISSFLNRFIPYDAAAIVACASRSAIAVQACFTR